MRYNFILNNSFNLLNRRDTQLFEFIAKKGRINIVIAFIEFLTPSLNTGIGGHKNMDCIGNMTPNH